MEDGTSLAARAPVPRPLLCQHVCPSGPCLHSSPCGACGKRRRPYVSRCRVRLDRVYVGPGKSPLDLVGISTCDAGFGQSRTLSEDAALGWLAGMFSGAPEHRDQSRNKLRKHWQPRGKIYSVLRSCTIGYRDSLTPSPAATTRSAARPRTRHGTRKEDRRQGEQFATTGRCPWTGVVYT